MPRLPMLAVLLLVRGLIFSHEAIREWEAKLAPILADELRQRRHGKRGSRGRHWHVDETYLKGRGRWAYTVQAGANSQLKQSFEAPMPALLANYVLGFGGVLA